MTQQRQRRPEARPGEVLDAALAVFTEKGFAAARMEDVARRAGLSKGGVYLYFPSKDALFEALIHRFAETVVATAAARLDDAGETDPVSALKSAVRFLLGVADDPRTSAAPRLVITEATRFPEIATLYRREVIDVGRKAVARIIDKGCREGLFRPVDREAAMRLLIGPILVHMLLTHVMAGHEPRQPVDLDALADGLVDILLHGIAAENREAGS